MLNMLPGPVKSLQIINPGLGFQAIRTSHRQLVNSLGTIGHPTPHPLGIGGVVFHILKVSLNSMLICLKRMLVKSIHDTPLEQEGVFSKRRAPIEVPPILLEYLGMGVGSYKQ
jgi:hypothetical protein